MKDEMVRDEKDKLSRWTLIKPRYKTVEVCSRSTYDYTIFFHKVTRGAMSENVPISWSLYVPEPVRLPHHQIRLRFIQSEGNSFLMWGRVGGGEWSEVLVSCVSD